ncbi:Aminomethyltransferase [Olavius sp. associated proteobacterium Delta 1]|nr:Aminomethyltransferase [Olavius sp. associated proteobacterium Delta 1]
MTAKETIAPISQYHIPPQTGVAFTVQKGQIIRVIDVDGEQVADLVCFARHNTQEYLSSGRSIDYNEKLFLSVGDILYSNRSNPMLSITQDPVGKHDFLFAPCSREMFRLTYGSTGPHPNCLDNLTDALGTHGIRAFQIPTAFNIFMNLVITAAGRVTVQPPLSKAGDYIDLSSEMDLIVGVSACSAGKCNNYRCTPIRVEIYPIKEQN